MCSVYIIFLLLTGHTKQFGGGERFDKDIRIYLSLIPNKFLFIYLEIFWEQDNMRKKLRYFVSKTCSLDLSSVFILGHYYPYFLALFSCTVQKIIMYR